MAAINLDDGSTRWTTPRSDDLRGVSDVMAGSGLVVVRSGFCDNHAAVALDPSTGAVVWRTDPGLAIDEVLRAAGVPGLVAHGVVIMTVAQRVVGLDTATGQAKWTAEVGQLVAESESVAVVWSPVAGLVRVLDRGTGAELWTLRTNQPLQPPSTSPSPGPANPNDLPPSVSAAADEERVYIRVDSDVTAHAAMDGNQQWSTSVGHWDGAVLLRGPDVLMTESNGGVVALDTADGTERWSVPNNTAAEQLGLHDARIGDGNLYLPLGPSLTAFDVATGKPRWQAPDGTFLVAAGGGRVLLSRVDGMHLVDAATGTELVNNTARANPQLLAGAAVLSLDSDSAYLGWTCGGG